MTRTLLGLALTFAIFSGEKASAAPLPLRVVKNQVVDGNDKPVRLRGVNVASMEWSSDGEGHILETVKVAVNDWRVNHVRLPLAQGRWFGKAREQNDEGKAYRSLVKQVVELCSESGVYVILDLHWSDTGEWGGMIGQHRMPDTNSVAFWKEVAGEYKNDPAVIFDLYNEPFKVSWDVWLKGGPVEEPTSRSGPRKHYEAVGMQTLLDIVRAAGAKNVVIAGGVNWSYDLDGILAGRQLNDPDGNGVIYANHAYPFKGDTVEKWVAKMEKASQTLPLIVSEFGSDPKGGSGRTGEAWVREVLKALESHNWAWTAWDLHPAAGPKLIADWKYTPTPHFGALVKATLLGTPLPDAPSNVGIFEGHQDVGTVPREGSVSYDADRKSYTVTGGGLNMWLAKDAFQYAWKKVSGDLSLAADATFVGTGKDPHRKACLMIRQTLDEDSAYVDVAVHGDGLTSLQFRAAKGEATHEVQANVSAPKRVRIVKRAKYVTMDVSASGGDLQFSGAATRITFQEPFYVGIGVCAHDKNVMEKAVFTNVELVTTLPSSGKPVLYSTLETQSTASTDRRVVHVATTRFEAPNWLSDGKTLIYNSAGRIYRVPATGGKPEVIDTGFATRCNNDHGLSPDGTMLAISDQSQGKRQSLIYTLPVTGGTPKQVTPTGPSYWHGWSPDGKTLAYCGERNGEFDIYTIPVGGGEESRLTTANGLDDGPEYSPDGKSIYFNSLRTGGMQIWRMNIDGSGQEQVTADEFNNWFPHPSPDNKSLVFLSYEKDVTGHPENKDVTLRRMNLATKKIDVLAQLFGGQGTVNVPCFSPDGKKIAFVTYQLIP